MTQRNKNILLLIGFVLFLVVSYRMAISKTFYLKREIEKMENESLNLENLANLSSNLSLREQFSDSVLKKNNIRNISIQNSLLEFLNRESLQKGFAIEQFLEPHVSLREGVKVTSYQFTLRGPYKDIQQVIYQLEQDYSFGQISHVSFLRKKDFRRSQNYLECYVIMESFLEQ